MCCEKAEPWGPDDLVLVNYQAVHFDFFHKALPMCRYAGQFLKAATGLQRSSFLVRINYLLKLIRRILLTRDKKAGARGHVICDPANACHLE